MVPVETGVLGKELKRGRILSRLGSCEDFNRQKKKRETGLKMTMHLEGG